MGGKPGLLAAIPTKAKPTGAATMNTEITKSRNQQSSIHSCFIFIA